MILTANQIERIEQLREEWNRWHGIVRDTIGGWAKLAACAGIEREFYWRINDICDPAHEMGCEESINAGEVWWKEIRREAFIILREETRV